MNKSINILDKEYLQWVKDLCGRYRQSQIKAAVKVNVEQLKFNWLLGRDIVELHVEERWGESVITRLSKDLREAIPIATAVNSKIIKAMVVLMPDKEILKAFSSLTKPYFDQILRNEQESIRLTILRDTLLPKLMSGELKINATEVL